MTKEKLSEAVRAKLDGTKKQSQEVVDLVFDEITKSLKKGEEVAIAGFGSFRVGRRQARSGVNPRTGEKIAISAMNVPKFRAGKGLKEAVK